jgi:murein DD-endopeptidase MepM/ murein hydrolase activator NlpD
MKALCRIALRRAPNRAKKEISMRGAATVLPLAIFSLWIGTLPARARATAPATDSGAAAITRSLSRKEIAQASDSPDAEATLESIEESPSDPPALSPRSGTGLRALVVAGPDDSSKRSQSFRDRCDGAIRELRRRGVNVRILEPPYVNWLNVRNAAKGVQFFLYAGHGVADGKTRRGIAWSGAVGGLALSDGIVPPERLEDPRAGLRLAKNALVFMLGVDYAGGLAVSSAGAETAEDIGDPEMDRRTLEYAAPFLNAGAAGYYADVDPVAVLPALFAGQSLKSAFRSTQPDSPESALKSDPVEGRSEIRLTRFRADRIAGSGALVGASDATLSVLFGEAPPEDPASGFGSDGTADARSRSAGNEGSPPPSAADLLEEINRFRARYRLPALRRDAALDRAARRYAVELARGGSSGDEGVSVEDLLAEANYRAGRWECNVAVAARDPSGAVGSWEGSLVHRLRLLDSFSDAGAAVAVGRDGTPYWVLLLAVPSVRSSNSPETSVSPDRISPPRTFSRAIADFIAPGARIVSVWGDPRDGGRRRHEGVDIAGRRYTPVRAVEKGVVCRASYEREYGKSYGNVVQIDHGGYRTLYAHLDSLDVAVGQRVQKGERIGYMGNTGNARRTGPHVHFELSVNGERINPLGGKLPASLQAAAKPSSRWLLPLPGAAKPAEVRRPKPKPASLRLYDWLERTSGAVGTVTLPRRNQPDIPCEAAFDGGDDPLRIYPEETASPHRIVGYPIAVAYSGDGPVEFLTATLRDATGAEVPVWKNTPRNDPRLKNAVFLIPRRPLKPRSLYRVMIVAIDEKGSKRIDAWPFATAP